MQREPCFFFRQVWVSVHTWLFLRENAEPLSDVSGFLDRVMLLVHSLAVGAEESQQATSGRCRSGMKNELSKVERLCQGIYSSATAQLRLSAAFYSMIKLPGRRACIIMGDVSGKVLSGYFVHEVKRHFLPTGRKNSCSYGGNMNNSCWASQGLGTFATLFVGIVGLAAPHQLMYCSAGHPPAILVSCSIGRCRAFGRCGQALLGRSTTWVQKQRFACMRAISCCFTPTEP